MEKPKRPIREQIAHVVAGIFNPGIIAPNPINLYNPLMSRTMSFSPPPRSKKYQRIKRAKRVSVKTRKRYYPEVKI